MRQVTTKKLTCSADFSACMLLEAIGLLYNPSFERPLEDTRFTVLLPNSFSGHDMIKNDELKNYQIDWVICRKGILEYDSWIVICPDSGSVLTCEGA